MKYKCVKDYWMDNESVNTGHKPAFVAGVVYEFHYWNDNDAETLFTEKDNKNRRHFMDKEEMDNSGYFELVEG